MGIRKTIAVTVAVLAAIAGAPNASSPALGASTATSTTTSAAGDTSDVTGAYYKVTPTRVLDTRTGEGGVPIAQLGASQKLSVKTTSSGIPATGASAVVLNLTVTNSTTGGWLVVYPHDFPRPNASTINFPAGFTGANLVTVPIGASGTIDVFNYAGSVDVIADVLGFYAADDSVSAPRGQSGGFIGVLPIRLFDSRIDLDEGQIVPFSNQDFVTLPVNFGEATNPHITSLVVNITATQESASGFVRAWDGGVEPTTSTLNFAPGKTVANSAVVPTQPCTVNMDCAGLPSSRLKVYGVGSTHLIVDLVGVMLDGTLLDPADPTHSLDWRYKPVATPQRIIDTRTGLGGSARLGPQSTTTFLTPSDIAGPNTAALAANLTAVAPSTFTYFIVWASGDPQPVVSNINPGPGDVVANAAFVTVGGAKSGFQIFNSGGTADALVDVAGTFEYHQTSTLGVQKLTWTGALAPKAPDAGVVAANSDPSATRGH